MRAVFGGWIVGLLLVGSARAAEVGGTLKVWHTVELSFRGPSADAAGDAPNPFLDYRLNVRFEGPQGARSTVPGYFDGDGAGGLKGNVWRVRFCPEAAGRWSYVASFRSGPNVAVEGEGEPAACDGEAGAFVVAPLDPSAPGVLALGRLEYVGKHYLKFKDGPYWIKGGCDEPENLLAYSGFVNTPPTHKFADHAVDWSPGDPDWGDGKGKPIVGAINYLAKHHVNSIYFLVMNVGGDGKDVWPWLGTPAKNGSPNDDNRHFDLAKLRQWEILFEHAQRKGLVLHFVFNEAEAENKKELDDGELGPERKVYYREILARFGHHPALEWNLCEEYNLDFNFGPDRIRAFAAYLRSLDPYRHPITVHSAGDPVKMLAFTFGDPLFGMTSVQLNQRRIDQVTEAIREATTKAGRPLPASMDEFTVDRGQKGTHVPVDDPDGQRKEKLWPTYLSGGMIEYILEGLIKVDTFKTPAREKIWDQTWHARRFLEQFPFWDMNSRDDLLRGGATIRVGIGNGKTSDLGPQLFARPGAYYAAWLPDASRTGEIDLTDAPGRYRMRWYDPRKGEFQGADRVVEGGGLRPIGPPPFDPSEDWAFQLVKINADGARAFPGRSWETRLPVDLGLDGAKLDALAADLGGRGCVIKSGYVVKSWGDQAVRRDWASSAKPVLSTLLLFAIQEGKVKDVDQPIADFGWNLSPKDRAITFRHLGAMTSGYARPEPPGAAWAYNDYAINLYQKTLFDRVFKADPDAVANAVDRLGGLGLEDGLVFRKTNRRLSASVRDFARLDWFWLNKGRWADRRLLPSESFDRWIKPQAPVDLPPSAPAETNDDLGIGTYGGGSDHFAKAGPGVYGFNFWFNATGGRRHAAKTWPDAPDDTVTTLGVRGNSSAFIPSLDAVLVAAEANWGELDPGNPAGRQNVVLRRFVDAVTPAP